MCISFPLYFPNLFLFFSIFIYCYIYLFTNVLFSFVYFPIYIFCIFIYKLFQIAFIYSHVYLFTHLFTFEYFMIFLQKYIYVCRSGPLFIHICTWPIGSKGCCESMLISPLLGKTFCLQLVRPKVKLAFIFLQANIFLRPFVRRV